MNLPSIKQIKQDYYKILNTTAGAWDSISTEQARKEKKQHKLEIKASKKARQVW